MMVLINLGAREANIPSLTESCVLDFQGLRDRFMRKWILCGQKWIEMWVQVDSAPWIPCRNTWRNSIENNWTSQIDWLTNTGGPTFLDPGVWKGLYIDRDVLKAAGATDWIVVQGPSATSPVSTNLSQHQLDPGRPLTRDEEYMLITLRKQKKKFAEIAMRLGRDELQVVCKYVDIVPLPSAGGPARQPNPEVGMREESSGLCSLGRL